MRPGDPSWQQAQNWVTRIAKKRDRVMTGFVKWDEYETDPPLQHDELPRAD
jgi:hypothetical protein